jgi:hypothetical protein
MPKLLIRNQFYKKNFKKGLLEPLSIKNADFRLKTVHYMQDFMKNLANASKCVF